MTTRAEEAHDDHRTASPSGWAARAECGLTASFVLGLALLLSMAVFFAVQAVRFLASDQWVAHTHWVIQEVERTLFEVQAAGSSQRGYTASGQETYLPPYQAAVGTLPVHLEKLRRATRDNPVQQRNVGALCTAVDAKLALMRERFDQRRTLGMAALDAKYLNGSGRRSMESVIAAGKAMIDEENTLLGGRAASRSTGLHAAVGMLLGTSVLGACLLTAAFFLIRRELGRSRALGEALTSANAGLEVEVAGRRQAERRLSTQHAVAQIAAESVSSAKAVPLFLQSICEHLGWELGELWTVDSSTDRMQLTECWYPAAGPPAQVAVRAAFMEESRHWTFAPGEGLPGQVWSAAAPIWEHDLQHSSCFLRSELAQTAGFHRAFAFPLCTGRHEQITGVMVFLSKEQGKPDEELMAAMDTVAGQIAQFTERWRAEAGLRASQARFSAFIENAPALAYIKDEEGRMVYGNETLLRTFGLRVDQWLGKTDADIWPESAPAIRENDRKVLSGDGALELNESVPLPNGRMTQWLSYKFPLRDEASGRKMLAGISIDITAREEAEENRRAKEEAERSSRAKSEFLSRVSHELRTPLNAILGFGQLLQASSLEEQDVEALDYILKAGRHLLALVDEVLDLSRAESGELHLSLGRVPIGGMVHECVNLVARIARAREITCEIKNCEEAAFLWCDEQRLRQILLNLLSNAIKYNRQSGSVLVSAERTAGNRLRLKVTDTGPGISPDEIKRLFVPFERLEQKGGKVEGIGLGLVVSRRMAEAMDGALGVESETGRGSVFWIELPLSTEVVGEGPGPDLDPQLLSRFVT